jgi:hypothetical protein
MSPSHEMPQEKRGDKSNYSRFLNLPGGGKADSSPSTILTYFFSARSSSHRRAGAAWSLLG